MPQEQAKPAPAVIDEASVTLDGWDDPVRGRVKWRTLFSRGLTPTDALTCGVAEFGPGDRLERHRHAPTEVYYIFAGEGVVYLDGDEIPVKPGAAVFIPGMAEHGVRQTGAETLRLFYVFPVNSFDGVEYLFEDPAEREMASA
ncbi:MAG: cupin domain-containing protein [Hyphomicrobiales bacterium]|nr:cupin domain-containing protein [Hyphomicrobiales bacterium]